MEFLLENAAALGVSEIVPVITGRTVIHPRDERWDHQRMRWEKILMESAQQSEQASPPLLRDPLELKTFLEKPLPGPGFVFWERETESFRKKVSTILPVPINLPVTLIVGPEGGFQQNEIELCLEKGYISVSLGPQKLRSETAVLVALTLLQYELGYFGRG